jgi:hypothetical protein
VPLNASDRVPFVTVETTPGGSVPVFHVIGVVPPLVAIVAAYAVPTVPLGSVVVVILTLDAEAPIAQKSTSKNDTKFLMGILRRMGWVNRGALDLPGATSPISSGSANFEKLLDF